MGDNVVSLKGKTTAHGPDAVAQVVAWLREQADEIEKGEARPVHKAILTVFEDCGDKVRTHTVFCNVSSVERVGIMFLALNDTANTD